jgi:hypothetical protein
LSALFSVPGGKIDARFTRYRDSSKLSRMTKLPVASAGPHENPAVGLKQLNEVFDLHVQSEKTKTSVWQL